METVETYLKKSELSVLSTMILDSQALLEYRLGEK